MLKVAVLISGRGSNLQALIDACARDDFPAEIVRVISNKADAYGLVRAQNAGIDTAVIDHKNYPDRETFEDALHEELTAAGTELICLAGFMRILNAQFVNRWRDRMLNIHPSLLPAFKGLHTHERVLEAGVGFTGCTVHFVRPEMDDGPIIMQAAVAVDPHDDASAVAGRVLKMEHIIYPEALRLVAEGQVKVSGIKVEIKDATYSKGYLVNPEPLAE